MKLSTPDKEKLRAEFNSIGEIAVREKLSQGIYNPDQKPFVEAWLFSEEASRTAASSERREAREIKTLEIAKSANELASEASRSASRANWIAGIAAAAAIVAAIAAIMANINDIDISTPNPTLNQTTISGVKLDKVKVNKQ